MTIIPPTKSPQPTTGPARARRPGGGFTVGLAGGDAAGAAAEPETAATTSLEAVHLGSLLALQEAGPESPRDRAARRHARRILDLLRDLQHAALGAAADPETLPRLTRLAIAMPEVDNPALAEVLNAIAIRAAVELARRDMAPPIWPNRT